MRDKCPKCGSERLVSKTPVVAGPNGWGQRCKDCGENWSVTEDEEDDFRLPQDGTMYEHFFHPLRPPRG